MPKEIKVWVVVTDSESGMLHVYDATCPVVINEALVRLTSNAETTGQAPFIEGHLIGTARTQSLEEFSASIGANQQEPAGHLHETISDPPLANQVATQDQTQPDSNTAQERVFVANPNPADENENPPPAA